MNTHYVLLATLVLIPTAFVGPSASIRQEPIREAVGKAPGDFFGVAVAGGGDVNADGVPDLIVGAYDYTQQNPYLALAGESKLHPGYVQVLSGKDGTVLFEFLGKSKEFGFGIAVADAGDVNSDGHSDVLVGSPFTSARALVYSEREKLGRAYVYSGKDGSVLAVLEDEAAGGSFGNSVAGVGDLNADGHADVAVGCSQLHPTDGSVLVLSGKDWSVLHRLEGEDGEEDFGSVVRGAGDVDGDGVPDLVIGGRSSDKGGRDKGVAKVISGKSGKVLHTWRGKETHSSFGSSATGIGDIDGDGRSDVLVCAMGLDTMGSNAGGAFVYSGRDGHVLISVDGPAESAEFGVACCALGDVDGDTIPDFAIAAFREPGPAYRVGKTRVYSGADGSILFECLGVSISFAGDLDDDGFGDLLTGVCTPDASGGKSDHGSVAVFSVAQALKPSDEKR